MAGNNDPEANLLARAYKLILSWPENPEALNQAADEALTLAIRARAAAVVGELDRAEELRGKFDSLWDRIEGALDE